MATVYGPDTPRSEERLEGAMNATIYCPEEMTH